LKNHFGETPLDCAGQGKTNYFKFENKKEFWPVLRRAFTENGRRFPEIRFIFGSQETKESHPWTPKNWVKIIELLEQRSSNP
jgi:hypothetical protein